MCLVVFRLSKDYIKDVFPLVSPFLQSALEKTAGEYLLSDIYDLLLKDLEQLWIGCDETTKEIELAFTTKITEYPQKRVLIIHLVGATPNSAETWLVTASKSLEEFCKLEKIDFIQAFGRLGWLRYNKDLGYTKYVASFIKELRK